MSSETKTKKILFDNCDLWTPAVYEILREFRDSQMEQDDLLIDSVPRGIVITYTNANIVDEVNNRLRSELWSEDDVPLLRSIFPHFVDLQHYQRNRISHDALFPNRADPNRYTTPSPYVTPYLDNATYHPLMTAHWSGVAAKSAVSRQPTYELKRRKSPIRFEGPYTRTVRLEDRSRRATATSSRGDRGRRFGEHSRRATAAARLDFPETTSRQFEGRSRRATGTTSRRIQAHELSDALRDIPSYQGSRRRRDSSRSSDHSPNRQ